jgi:hypothetical protein
MQHLDEGMIHAWLDGQLPRDEAASIEAHVAECRPCADAVAEARGLIAASSRILTALDGVQRDVAPKPPSYAEASVSDGSTAPQPIVTASAAHRAQRRWFTGGTLAAAAMIVVAIGTVTIMRAGGGSDVVVSARPSAGPSVLDSAAPLSSPVPSPAPPSGRGTPNASTTPSSAREVAKEQANVPAAPPAANELRRDATDELRARVEAAAPKRFASADTTAVVSGARETVQRAQVRQQVAGAEPQKSAEQLLLKDAKKQEVDQDSRSLTGRGAASVAAQRPTDTAGLARQAAADAAAAQTTGGVRGRVTDANNTGLSSTSVHVLGTNTGVMTNETGEYVLGGLAGGAYKLVVRRVGYASVTRDFTVTVGQTANVNVVLAPAQLTLNSVVVTGAAERGRAKTAGAPARTAPTPAPTPAAPSAGPPPATLPTGESSPIGCYELGITSATPTRTAFRQVPRRMALDSVVVPANADGGIWYRARDLATTNTLPNGRWRPSGPGAVEVEWTAGSRVARVVLSGLGQAKLDGTVEEIDRATATGEGGTVVASRRSCG